MVLPASRRPPPSFRLICNTIFCGTFWTNLEPLWHPLLSPCCQSTLVVPEGPCFPSNHNQPILGVFQRMKWSDGARPLLPSPGLQLALIGIDRLSTQCVKPGRNNTYTHLVSLSFPCKLRNGNAPAHIQCPLLSLAPVCASPVLSLYFTELSTRGYFFKLTGCLTSVPAMLKVLTKTSMTRTISWMNKYSCCTIKKILYFQTKLVAQNDISMLKM